jgi:hypothetical protein
MYVRWEPIWRERILLGTSSWAFVVKPDKFNKSANICDLIDTSTIQIQHATVVQSNHLSFEIGRVNNKKKV